jgi:hypothetical protein
MKKVGDAVLARKVEAGIKAQLPDLEIVSSCVMKAGPLKTIGITTSNGHKAARLPTDGTPADMVERLISYFVDHFVEAA